MKAVTPHTEVVTEFPETPIDEIPELVRKARSAAGEWGELSVGQRAEVLSGLVGIIEAKKQILARTITDDMGKPIAKAEGEISYTADAIQFFCQHAADWLAPEAVENGYIEFDPLGVVAVISPWNYPYYTSIVALLPALLAGNGVLFKPSEYTPRSGIALAKLFEGLKGFPEGLLGIVVGEKEHGKALVEQQIEMVAFTGSTVAGKDIMKKSSERLTRVLLELGGLDAAILLDDADVEFSAREIVKKNCNNSGQVCCAVKRVYVERGIYDRFVEAAAQASKEVTVGDPLEDVEMGPLVAEFQLKKIEEIVADAKTKGAKVLSGGERLERQGYFYPHTLLANVNHDMRLMSEEPFGPILPIYPVDSWEEAVELANNSKYGLTGSVWTKNLELGKKVAKRLEVGVAGINSHGPGPVGTPWGGAKESGIGRMKDKQAMRGFSNTKLVCVAEQG